MSTQKQRLERKAAGKCYDCNSEAMPHRLRCKRCALMHNDNSKRLRANYRKNHKCTTCGAKLMPEEVEQGYKKCITHRERLTVGISQWGRS
jgi:hypothetical protein